jgi:hypothetical protein
MLGGRSDAIALAKAWLILGEANGVEGDSRKWLVGRIPPSYRTASNGGRILVREGSPPRGYILDTPTTVYAILPRRDLMKRFISMHVCETEYPREHRAARRLDLLPTRQV